MNGKRAKKARRDARLFAKEHPDKMEADGYFQMKSNSQIICAPKGPRRIYKMVKKHFGGRA